MGGWRALLRRGADPASFDSLFGRAGAQALGVALQVSRTHSWLLVGAALGVCWVSTAALGGASNLPPHAYYLPILFAGVRFGQGAALGVSLVSALLAGPLTYSEVATRTPQGLSDWGMRAVFFVLIGQAVTAMVSARTRGLTSELDDLRCTERLWVALDNDRVEVHFQPIVAAETGDVVGAEALARLRDPDGGTVAPAEFIPAAERTGMIRPIGARVLQHALARVAQWSADGLIDAGFRLHVNVSPRELDSPTFVDSVAGALRETGVEPGRLQLEITETAVAEDPERFIDGLHGLCRLGVRLALDDFGTGHSSLAQVQRLPIDVIKIDQSFVAALGRSPEAGVIAGSVTALARSLGLSTVAEGVETPEQAEILRRMGCAFLQGFLYGRPVPHDQFALGLLAGGDQVRTPDAAEPPPEQGFRTVGLGRFELPTS